MNIALRHNLMKNTPQREGHAKAVRSAARNCGVEEELHASASRRSGRALAVEVRADKVQKRHRSVWGSTCMVAGFVPAPVE